MAYHLSSQAEASVVKFFSRWHAAVVVFYVKYTTFPSNYIHLDQVWSPLAAFGVAILWLVMYAAKGWPVKGIKFDLIITYGSEGKFGWSVEIFFPYKKRSPIRHVVSCQKLQMMTVAERIASPIIFGSLSWQPVPICVRSEAFRALLCLALWMRGRLTGQSTFMVFKSLGLIVLNCCSWMLMARQIFSSVYVHLTEFIFL